ncbi:MAG: proline dehydrogenase family protein [Anaerolineae bacterium]
MKMQKSQTRWIPLLVGFAVISGLIYRFGERWLRALLLYLSTAVWARQLVTQLPFAWRVASRFVAGENIEAALATAKALNDKGMLATMDFLGESVTSTQDAFAARDEILRLLDRIHESGVKANVSVKLSQLGLKMDEALALDNVRQLLIRAQQYQNKIRIDMEESDVTEATLHVYRTLRDEYGFGRDVGIVIQSYLYRSEEDVQQLVKEGAWVRLCKGAYMEPPEVAYPEKGKTDASYVRLMQMMLGADARENGVYLGVASHDEKMIDAAKHFAADQGVSRSAFEFQMLYGIRRELQQGLVNDGYQVRIYVPYGTAWYPYFVRRLAERPANLWFFISNFLRN